MAEIQRIEDDKEFFFGEIHIDKFESDAPRPWKAGIEVNGQVVNFKLDSGADVSVLPERVYQVLHVNLEPTNKVLLGPCNYKLNCIGKFKAKLAVNQKSIDNRAALCLLLKFICCCNRLFKWRSHSSRAGQWTVETNCIFFTSTHRYRVTLFAHRVRMFSIYMAV